MQKAMDRLNVDRVVKCTSRFTTTFDGILILDCFNKDILSLQHPSGVFAGDHFGEIDTRFLYCAVSALSLLGKLDLLDKDKVVGYLESCKNYDGGFGNVTGSESHSAQGM